MRPVPRKSGWTQSRGANGRQADTEMDKVHLLKEDWGRLDEDDGQLEDRSPLHGLD